MQRNLGNENGPNSEYFLAQVRSALSCGDSACAVPVARNSAAIPVAIWRMIIVAFLLDIGSMVCPDKVSHIVL